MSKTILVGDIGGTNSRLLLFSINIEGLSADGLPLGKVAPGTLIFREAYQNEKFENFEAIVTRFFSDAKITVYPKVACIAVAGPVKNNTVCFTNRAGWTISGSTLKATFAMTTVKLINDFVAAGYGLLTLNHDLDCYTLQSAERNPEAPLACVGAGTGLGECFLTPGADGRYTCFASEGGHAEFAPRTELEVELLSFLKTKFAQKHRVSVERVVSGTGLVNVYEFLSSKFPSDVDAALHAEIEAAGDLKGKLIAENVGNKLCRMTMEIFVTAYGSEAGVACLKWIPKGGLYLAGGLTPKNLGLIKEPDGPFMKALLDKGRVSGIISEVPIYAVLVEDLGERGAHRVAAADLLATVGAAGDGAAAAAAVTVEEGVGGGRGRGGSLVLAWGVGSVLAVAVAALVLTRRLPGRA